MRFLYVAILCFALTLALVPTIDAQPTNLWTYEKYGGYIRLPTFSMPNAQVTYENTTEGFEFNITLTKKPAGSSFKVNIESGGWNWYYQPPLSQELNASEYTFVNATHAINNSQVVIFRPENIVGSYAVYGSFSGNEYGTGKVLHLYRPLLIDAGGAWCWGSLNVTSTTLTVSANQTWLANAVYPVVVDPTFGITSMGGTTWTLTSTNCEGELTAAVGSSGTLDKITVALWRSSSGSSSFKVAMYEHTDLSLVVGGTSVSQSFSSGYSGEWKEFTGVSGASVVSGTSYILAVRAEALVGCGVMEDSGDANERHQQDYGDYAAAWTDPFSVNHGAYRFSIYATYEVEEEDVYTLSLTVTSPDNDTYDETIPVSLSTTGNATNIAYNWNVKFSNGTWLYGVNKTSATYTIEIFENQTNCLFACVVTGDVDVSDYEEVYFSVVYVTNDAWDADLNNYFCATMLLVMGFVFMVFMVSRRRY